MLLMPPILSTSSFFFFLTPRLRFAARAVLEIIVPTLCVGTCSNRSRGHSGRGAFLTCPHAERGDNKKFKRGEDSAHAVVKSEHMGAKETEGTDDSRWTSQETLCLSTSSASQAFMRD